MWVGITFSFQVVFLMVVWTFTSFFINKSPIMDQLQSMLKVYGLLIAVIFYGIIVPMNGWSSNREDFVVHIVVPSLFWLFNYKNGLSNVSLLHFMIYPALYLCFMLCGGYTIYPFLDSWKALTVIAGIFVAAHYICLNKKQ